MDFDSIISFLLIILFFITPAVLKRLKKKTPASAPAGKVKNLSLFEKLGEQIRQYAENLEQDAAKGKQPRETQENIWDQLAGEEDFQDTYEESPEEAFAPVAQPRVSAADRVMPVKEKVGPAPTPKKHVFVQPPSLTSVFGQPKFSANQLQQAVIWSEILSKPIALRRD